MIFDITNKYFLSRVDDCVKHLSYEELDTLQGLIKKVDINCPRSEGYIVVSKADTPRIFGFLEELFDGKQKG